MSTADLPVDETEIHASACVKEIPLGEGKTRPAELAVTDNQGGMDLYFHAGQTKAWDSERRFIAIIAGTQSGKTVFGPIWLWREIQRKGRGDYLVVTPTFTLLELKALPAFKRFFEAQMKLGEYLSTPVRRFKFSADGERMMFGSHDPLNPTVIYFAYAEDPESLESMTVKAAWLDECGQKKFKIGSWEAIQRRLAVHEGRVLMTTTPYDFGWLKREVFDRYEAGDPLYDVVRFNSISNPAFSKAEYERARATMPPWKFALFYQGRFMRPAGLIYDCFETKTHTCKRFVIPPQWERYMGLDFGGANTAAVFLAAKPYTSKLYLYRIYKAGGRTAVEHSYHMTLGEPEIALAVGGARAEGQWRQEFRAGGKIETPEGKTVSVPGMLVRRPLITEVNLGIDRVYGTIKRDELIVFDDLEGFIDEIEEYSWEINANQEPTGDIEDKGKYHFLDSTRYVIGYIRGPLFRDDIPEEPKAKIARMKAEKEAEKITAENEEKAFRAHADAEDKKAQQNPFDPRWWQGGW